MLLEPACGHRGRAAAVFRFGRRVCGRRSRTLSRGPGSCGAGRLRTARQRGGCGAEDGTLITPLIPNESLRTACRVQSRMSMGSSALLTETDSLRLGEGFSGSTGDSEPHRICVAAGQAVSGGMRLMRGAGAARGGAGALQ